MASQGFCVWFVGLPGCGKSSISKRVYRELKEKGWDVEYLEMDTLRKKYFPNPSYTKEEREKAYEMFVEDAYNRFLEGKVVIMDGTAYKVSMRKKARDKMGDRFVEIYVKCSIETAMKRESFRKQGHVMAELYKKALDRKKRGTHYPGLGEVIGVDVEFEEDDMCEFVLKNDNISLDEAVFRCVEFIEKRLESL